jgi:hypothetical protein
MYRKLHPIVKEEVIYIIIDIAPIETFILQIIKLGINEY